MKLLLLLSIIAIVLSISPEPVPTCSRPDITLKDLPISLKEVQHFNLNDIFKGYNLNYSLIGAPEWVHLRNKFELFKSQKLPQNGFKSFHMDHDKNQWGHKLVTLSDFNNATTVRWGISNATGIPTVNNSVIVENDPKTLCYDAIWLQSKGLIIVDCAKVGNHALQNVFLYINVTTQKVLPNQVLNDMWIGFTQITRRRMVHYTEDGEEYIMRAYFADGVNKQQWHNTYVQIMLANNAFKPWTIKVMDRSFLHQDQLSITDFKVYLGDIYILDYHSGVISFDITPSQNIIIKGRYRTDSGFHKLGVYTNNLDNEVLLALANEHGIYEVDWTNQLRPNVIAKYSLMEGSRVSSLWVNEEYIACQVRANVTNSTNQTQEYHSTLIFDRGTRTYMNAYAVIHHSTYRAAVDLDIAHNALLSIDEDSIDTYYLDEPIMFLWPSNTTQKGKEYNFTVKANSSNENNGQSLVCTFDFRFIIVDADSMTLWPTGIPAPDTYYANYPGELAIPLHRYVIGANVTWGVQEKLTNETGELPNYWILQQNDTIVHWEKGPSMFKYTFLRKEQFEYMSEEFFFIYAQDATNATHISECRTVEYSKDVYCQEDSHFPHINYKIDNLTATAFLPNYGTILHLVAVLYEQFPNEVFIYDVHRREMFAKPIILGKDWEGKIQSIEFLGHYLVVVLRHMKTIIFYDMKQCYDHQEKICEPIYKVDSIMMDKLGVDYFSPVQVYTSDFHPFVLFIQNINSVIILDITRQGPILLQNIESAGSQEPGFWKWKLAITKGHLTIINPPNLIQEYSLFQLYTRKVTHPSKTYPLYNYTIPDKFDCDFSDQGDLLYITALDKELPAQKNSVILVYRSDTPAVAAFYDVFHIEGNYDDMLIDVTGSFADYISVAMGSMLMMFRQYQIPILVFEDTWSDFSFNLTYTNDKNHSFHYMSPATVKIANYPEKIIINESALNETDFLTNQVNYEKKYKEVVLNDTNWFNGTVLNYTVEGCQECGSKIRVVNHVQDKRDVFSEADMEDYVFTPEGGVIQQFQSIIKMRHNGSIDQVAQFPSVLDGERCTHITHSWIYDYTLSACEHLGEIYLYTTTFSSFKPFVNGPFYSGAKYAANIQIMEDILVIVDVDENPQHRLREGGVLIMAMNHDPYDPEMFDFVEIIETDDLEHAVNWPGGPAFIGDAKLLFTNDSSVYRLVITEVRHGLFFVDFKWTRGRQSIEITKVEFIDLNKLMIKENLHMPNLAYFWGVAITAEYYDQTFKYWQLELVVTTTRFHTLKFDFHIDKTGTVLDAKLTKVFYRYGYYDVAGYVKSFDGYFVVIHNLPASLEPFDEMARKVLSVYDTRERWVFQSNEPAPVSLFDGTNVPATWMLGGMRFKKGRISFDFNFTFTRNRTDPFRDIGLLVVHDRESIIREVGINDQVRIILEDEIYGTQDAKFKANSDFGSVEIPLKVIGLNDGLSAGAIVAIIIGSLLVVVGGGYLLYRWNLKRKEATGKELEESLIDRDTLNVPKDEDQDSDDEEDEEDEDEEEEEEEEEEKEEVKEEAKPQPEAQGDSGNQVEEKGDEAQTTENAGDQPQGEQEKKQ